jgi:uncharacterized protein YjiS (DUF1127 family)
MLGKIMAAVRRNQDQARTRRDYRKLLSLDDHLLRDIGLPRYVIRARMHY